MFSKVKNYFLAFAISFVTFGFVALFVVDLVIKCIGGAFTIGDIGKDDGSDGPSVNPSELVTSDGNSLYFLAVVTDYRPSFYGDYDYDYIKEKFGALPAEKIPGDLKPSSSSVINLPQKPKPGTLDTTGSGSGVIGGLISNDCRTIKTDIILLVRMDKESQSFTFTPFPGNSKIEYGGEEILMRDLYYRHGLEALVNVVHSITGIRPERHIVLHSEYVDDVVNLIGGIDAVIPMPIKAEDAENDISVNIPAGGVHMDGEAVKQFLLYNGYREEDKFSIEKAGILVLRSLLSSMTQSAGYANAGDKFATMRTFCITDMLLSDIVENRDVWYAYSTYKKEQLDVVGRYVTDGGEEYYDIDEEKTLKDFVDYRKKYK